MGKIDNKPYVETINEIRNTILSAKPITAQGNKFLDDMYKGLNEAETPLLSLKRFISGGEALALQDTTVKQVLDFTKKAVTSNIDLNFLINLCKEEHILNLKKSGHPAPQETLKKIEDLFGKSSSVIEQGVRNGLFDDLKSELYMKISAGLKDPKSLVKNVQEKTRKEAVAAAAGVKLNESRKAVIGDGFVRYCPIGFIVSKSIDGKSVALMENHVFTISKGDGVTAPSVFSPYTEPVDLTTKENRLAAALNKQPYNPRTGTFGLNEAWDFDMLLTSKGDVKLYKKDPTGNATMRTVDKSHVKQLLFESMDYYKETGKITDVTPFLVDTDNFVALMENAHKLILFDNLHVYRSLNESITDFAIVPVNQDATLKMFHKGQIKLYENYSLLKEAIDGVVGQPIIKLFENEIYKEQQASINKLYTKQLNQEKIKSLNEAIARVDKLMVVADEGSAARNELNGQKKILTRELQSSLKQASSLI
jgi:hypothetical protein